jgi:DNA-binding GntR family transcriptional regulator
MRPQGLFITEAPMASREAVNLREYFERLLADPDRGGMPELLREAFGETYSTDVLNVRQPTPAEAERLDLPPGTPVQVIHGGTYDGEHRPLHFIEVIGAGGRVEFAYVYGAVPSDA